MSTNSTVFANGSTVLGESSDGVTWSFTITPGWQQVTDAEGNVSWSGPTMPPNYVASDARWPGANIAAAPPQPQASP